MFRTNTIVLHILAIILMKRIINIYFTQYVIIYAYKSEIFERFHTCGLLKQSYLLKPIIIQVLQQV